MIQKIKIIKTLIIIFSLSLSFSANAQTVEEIIKGRKAMFSENYQNAKKISILLKSKRIEEAKPLMKKISDNYIKLLDYFPENAKEGFKTGALPSIWENKDEFNALMKKASDDMIKLAKAIDTAEDLRENVYVRESLETSQLSAKSGTRFRSVSKETNPPKISTTMAADVVSEVRCGSKVGGSAHNLLNTPPASISEPTDASAIVLISDFSLGTEEDIGDVDSDEEMAPS